MNDATIDALRERELLDWDTGCLRRITTCANLEPNALDESSVVVTVFKLDYPSVLVVHLSPR
jgi:hypothetical protein